MALQFVQHKKSIYDTVGDFYYPNVSPAEKQIRIKHLNSRLDFDASIRKWEREWHIPELASIMQRRCTVQRRVWASGSPLSQFAARPSA